MGKRTAQKDTIIDTTSDSQVNSNFPHRWSPASLIFNNYLYLYLYITRITVNNNMPRLKSPKNQNRRAAFGRPAMKLLGASTSLRSTNPHLSSALVPQAHSCLVKPRKNQNIRAALGRPAIKLLDWERGASNSLRSTCFSLVPHTLNSSVCMDDS